MNHGMFGCFVSAVREKGVKRALLMVADCKALAAEFQAKLDQSLAGWWDPDPLWEKAKGRTAELFAQFPGPAPAVLGQAA
jgi:hypothetical protein